MIAEVYKACRFFLGANKHVLFNSYVFGWESDVFSLTKAGYSIEIEVKVSRADYIADFKKAIKHRFLTNHNSKNCVHKKNYTPSQWGYIEGKFTQLEGAACAVTFAKPQEKIPNRFYYACPTGLIKEDDLPGYAGLIWVDDNGAAKVIKKAPLLHKLKNIKESDLFDKYYWRVQNALAKSRLYANRDYTVDELKAVINQIKNTLY